MWFHIEPRTWNTKVQKFITILSLQKSLVEGPACQWREQQRAHVQNNNSDENNAQKTKTILRGSYTKDWTKAWTPGFSTLWRIDTKISSYTFSVLWRVLQAIFAPSTRNMALPPRLRQRLIKRYISHVRKTSKSLKPGPSNIPGFLLPKWRSNTQTRLPQDEASRRNSRLLFRSKWRRSRHSWPGHWAQTCGKWLAEFSRRTCCEDRCLCPSRTSPYTLPEWPESKWCLWVLACVRRNSNRARAFGDPTRTSAFSRTWWAGRSSWRGSPCTRLPSRGRKGSSRAHARRTRGVGQGSARRFLSCR